MSRYSNDYPDDWKAIADHAKDEAGWRCVRCKHPHETPKNRVACDAQCRHANNGKQRILTTHHLDGDKANCRWWNTAALCQVCHLQIQGKVRMERRWFLPHSDWFKTYAAGYYAHLNGLPDDREFVTANIDMLLQPNLFEAMEILHE